MEEKKLKQIYEKMIRMYNDLYIHTIDEDSKHFELLPRLYVLYNNFNADETYVEQVEETIINDDLFDAIMSSELDEDSFEIIHAIRDTDSISDSFILELIDVLDRHLVEAINKTNKHKNVVNAFNELKIEYDSNIKVSILTDANVLPYDKSMFKEIVTTFNSKVDNANYNIYFKDDIIEMIDDIENPKLSVENGHLDLMDDGQKLIHGHEKSLVVSISAKSLKEIYLKYATKGLFSSNLRYYVKSAKIDKDIKYSIISEPHNFWYFNNGIIITCSNYEINNKEIVLSDFSIVNGGQTTNLIGNTVFDEDFPILCKVILPQTDDEETNQDFLARVAETSNTQKPIKARDLIANRPEQRRLKIQFKRIDVFLHVKRGEKIDRITYPAKWQNASNDEVGQMLFSFVFQKPGSAKNSKSAMLMKKENYRLIYESKYSDNLLLSLQYIKVAFNEWKTYTKKTSEDITKIAIASNSIFMFYGIIGFLAKLFINEKARNYFFSIPTFSSYNIVPEFSNWMVLNDVGYTDLFLEPTLFSSKHLSHEFFDFIYETFVGYSYEKFKKDNPNFGPGHFTKSDNFYYDRVIRTILIKSKANWNTGDNYEDFLGDYFTKVDPKELKISTPDEAIVKLGLREELKEFRRVKFKEHSIKPYEVFKDVQLENIVISKPTTTEMLKRNCGLRTIQIEKFGEDIISIVKKYLIE
jgi:hypothetical protein